MADNIVVSYQSNVDDLIAQLKDVRQLNAALTKQVEDFGKKSKESSDKAKQSTSELSNLFNKLGTQIAAAFSVGAVIAFGKASFEAFAEAELSAKKLQAAIGAQGGLQKDFQILINQSKELQKQSIFSDEAIQGIQTLALQFGLSREAVQKLTPEIIDFASATGQDLNSALSAVLRGIEGQARGLKVYGVEINTTGTRAEKFASIMEQLNQKFEGQGRIVADTAAGRLKQLSNAWNDLQETIGGAIAPLVAGAASLVRSFIGITEVPISQKLEQEKIQLEQTTIKLSSLNEGTKERSIIIARLQSQYPGYLDNIKGEELSNDDLQKALRKVNDQLVLKIALAKGDEGIADAQEKVAEALLKTSKQEGILISQINNRLQKAPEEFKASLQGLTLDQQAIKIREAGLDVSGKIIESVDNRVKAEEKLKVAQDELTKAQQKRIEEEQRLRGILNIPPEEEKKTGLTGLEKKTEAELKADEDAAKRLREARQKDDKETRDAQAALAKFTFDELNKNADQEAANRKLTASETIDDENKLQQAILQIDEDTLKQKIQNAKDTFEDSSDLEIKLTEVLQKEAELRKKILHDVGKEIHPNREDFDKSNKAAEEGNKELQKNFVKTFDAIADSASQLLSRLQSLFNAQDENAIASINNQKDAELSAIDQQLAALDEAHNKRKIGDKKYEESKKKLLAQRTADEKKAADETKKLKIQEAQREKEFSIFSIILSTARAIIAALGTIPPNPALAVIAGITGAAELAIAVATPIPAFAKGTKGKRNPGMGIVGERGAELVYMPDGTQVVPADRTRKYKEVVNSLIDNNFEQYVYKAMIAPALREATRKMEKDRQKSFAENIANYFKVNNETNPYRVYDGVRMNNKELANAIGKVIAKNIYQGYQNPRYH